MKVGVPLRLFTQSPTGFGFFLAQQTAVCVDTRLWNALADLDMADTGNTATELTFSMHWARRTRAIDGIGAQLLGNLDPNAEGPYNYALADPPTYSNEAVGGFATAADRIALVAPWVALTSILGVALVIAVRMAKRRKA